MALTPTPSTTNQTKALRTAVIFPGQGSQSVGMMRELAEQYPIVQQTFAEASATLDEDLWAICEDEQRLSMTQFTQPVLLTSSIAVWRILQPQLPQPPCYLAGHSLGEYSALCASGALSLSDAVSLVHLRGQLMQQVVVGVETAMAAVLGLEDQCVVTLCEQACEHVDGAIVNAANFNSPGQVVISGNQIGVNAVIESVQNIGKKAILLKVSVPSHCDLMQPITQNFADALAKVTLKTPNIPVIQNRDAQSRHNPNDIKNALIEQLSQPVLWSQTMQALSEKHIALLIECGNGNVLSNLAKRQAQPIASYPTDKPSRLEKLMEEFV